MANETYTQIYNDHPASTPLTGSEIIVFTQDGQTVGGTTQDIANLASPGGNTIYTGNDSLADERTVDLAGFTLHFSQDGNDFLTIDPTTNSESTVVRAYNTTDGGNEGRFGAFATDAVAAAVLEAKFNNNAKDAVIEADADASTATITYTADSHTFNGAVNMASLAGTGTRAVMADADGNLSAP